MVVAKSSLRRNSRAAGKLPSDPVVSVIMPVYNRAQRVHTAIKSVLAQTYQDYELIVVDDGSTDDMAGSLSTINDTRLRIISLDENKGASTARNTGISEARGTYIALLDSDDLWLPEKLERQVEFMRAHAGEFRLSCTGYKIVRLHYRGHESRTFPSVITERDLQSGCRVSPGATLMAEKSLFTEVGPLREDLRRLEDWDWLLRCSKFSNLAVLGDVLSVVDYTNTDHIDYGSVRKSVDILKCAHFASSGFWPSGARRRYLAALENELAATAFRTNKYGKALWHLLRSFSYVPYRNLDYFRRISTAVFATTFQSVSGPDAFPIEVFGPEALAADRSTSVLHIITGLGTGGAENILCQLVLALNSSSAPQYVISLKDRGVHAKYLEEAGVPVTALNINSLLTAPSGFLKLSRLISRLKPDVVQGWMYHGNLAAALANRFTPGRASRRLYWNIRASNMDAKRHRSIIAWNVRLSTWPNVIICNSNAGSEFVIRQGFRAKRMEIIRNGINTDKFQPDAKIRKSLRKELGIAEDAIIVINVARVDPMKDHATFLAAMEAIPHVQGLLVGTDTDTLELSDNVMALGMRTDVDRFYQAADIVVSSSAFGEGFSNAIGEGMACGLVPVATDVGDSGVIAGDTGTIVAPGDPQALADAITTEAALPREQRRARGLQARQRILDNFTIESMTDRFTKSYKMKMVLVESGLIGRWS